MAKPASTLMKSVKVLRHWSSVTPETDPNDLNAPCSLIFIAWDDEDDHMYTGQFKRGHAHFADAMDWFPSPDTHEAMRATMDMVPDEAVFPKLPDNGKRVPVAPESCAGPDFYIKRPRHQPNFASHNWDNHLADGLAIPDLLLHEARMFDLLSQHPQHPNIVGYHGCRVRRGFITGLMLDMVPGRTLMLYLQFRKLQEIDKGPFFAALESAVDHLHHVVGIAHNDLHPDNIIVRPDGMPCVIDFDAAAKIGHRTLAARSCPPWDDEKGNLHVSQKRHDLYGLAKIRWMLDHPDEFTNSFTDIFPVRIRLEVDPAEPDDPDKNSPLSRPRVPGSKLPDSDQDGVHLDE